MFDNIGGKMKTLATVLAVIGIIGSIISGCSIISKGLDYDAGVLVMIGLLVMVLGALLSWSSAFSLYGLGEIIENSQDLRDDVSDIKKLLAKKMGETQKTDSANHQWRCYNCGNMVDSYPCKHCGHTGAL